MSGDAEDFLFDGSSAPVEASISVNPRYAARYEKQRRDERIAKLEAEVEALEASIESEEEIEDEIGELVTGNIAGEFLEVYSKIRRRDPTIYQKDTKFFQDEGTMVPAVAENRIKQMQASKEPKENQFLKYGIDYGEDDEDDDDGFGVHRADPNDPRSYAQQQEDLRRELRDVAFGGHEGRDSNGGEDDLLVQRKKGEEEEARLEAEYKRFLDKKRRERIAQGDSEMRAFWMAQDKGEEEQQQRQEKEKQHRQQQAAAAEELTEKERFLRDYILNNGWVDEDAAGRRVTQAELDALSESEEMLDRADEFESKLNMRFEDPDAVKTGPQTFPRDLPSVRAIKPKARQLARQRTKESKKKERERLANELKQLKAQKRKEIMAQVERRGGGGRGKLDLGEADLAARLETMDEDQLDKFLDDYLKLDYEDVVAGKKTRFKYTEVKPDSFGLQEEDILRLDDQVLEKYVPIRALAPYREEEFKPTANRRNFLKKQKLHAEEELKHAQEQEVAESTMAEEKRRKREEKKRKKEKKKRRKAEEEAAKRERKKRNL